MTMHSLLAMGAPAGDTQQDPKAQMIQMVVLFVILGAILYYFLLSRPQSKQEKEAKTSSAGLEGCAAQRYADAYLIARMLTAVGGVVKRLGVILAMLVGIMSIVQAIHAGANGFVSLFIGIIAGFIIAIPVCVLGIFVSAYGQVLKANLDTAVHTSPFLDNEQKSKVMSLQ